MALLTFMLALPAGAEGAPPPERAECNACTARHKAMQRLQVKRRAAKEAHPEADAPQTDAQEPPGQEPES